MVERLEMAAAWADELHSPSGHQWAAHSAATTSMA